MTWDPKQYARYVDERARPFHDLVARIPTVAPADVVDLGCGPGTMTATLCERWPGASVVGIDSSPQMIEAASARPGLSFRLGAIESWEPVPVDVIVSNAALHWVPDHVDLLPRWSAALRPGGALAFQVPSMADSPAGAVFASVARSTRWADRLAAVDAPRTSTRPAVPAVRDYADLLAGAGLRVDAWETTYLHILSGPDPVLSWFTGTGLRPYLDALADDPAALVDFRTEIAAGLRAAYPPAPYGTILPFRRIFVVGVRG